MHAYGRCAFDIGAWYACFPVFHCTLFQPVVNTNKYSISLTWVDTSHCTDQGTAITTVSGDNSDAPVDR